MIYDFEYYKKNFPDKFLHLLNVRYSHDESGNPIPAHKHRQMFVKAYDKKYPEGKSVKSAVSSWCAFNTVPDLDRLLQICTILDCDIDYFLTEQETFSKSIESAADVTGLAYESVEVLSNSNKMDKTDSENYLGKKLIFTMNFMLKSKRCRQFLDYLFMYWFKKYSFMVDNNGGGTNALILEDESGIDERNVGFWISDVSESFLYSSVMQAITRIKDLEAINVDPTAAEYTPAKADIENDIKQIEEEIKIEEVREYSKYFPYDIRKGIQAAYSDGISFGRLDPDPKEELESVSEYGEILSEEVSKRYAIDYECDQVIENKKHKKERLEYKLQKLYPDSKS